LDELGFELPLVGGDEPVGEVTTAEMAAVFAKHLGTGGPLSGYAASLAGPALSTRLRGYLIGSLDLVFRLGGKGREERYFVVDYKTNWLGPPGEELCAWHYRRPALEEEMCISHYVLQAAFYLVALHRYLRWRLPAYDPSVHLGGAVYLFLRGMTGPRRLPGPTLRGVRLAPAGAAGDGVVGPLLRARSPLMASRQPGTLLGPDAELVLGEDEDSLVGAFNRAGVLAAADVHVARVLARLGGEQDASVVLAAALAVRAPRAGHVPSARR
jgi:hypothetical protein